MTKPITVSALKKELKEMDQKALMDLILELYKSEPKVKDQLSAKFLGKEFQADSLTEYKKKMVNIFFNNNLSLPSMKKAKDLILDFKKIGNEEQIMDLMLVFVECGAEYAASFGVMPKSFYNSVLTVCFNFVERMLRSGTDEFYHKIKPRVRKVLSDASEVGWGFDYGMENIVYQLFAAFEEDDEEEEDIEDEEE